MRQTGACRLFLLGSGPTGGSPSYWSSPTVIGWQRKGFRRYWNWKCRRGRGGRPWTPQEIRTLIRDMSSTNVYRGAPRLHGELLRRGNEVSQASVPKYLVRQTLTSPSSPSTSAPPRTAHSECLWFMTRISVL